MRKVCTAGAALLAIGIGVITTKLLYHVPKTPKLDLQRWWGNESSEEEDITIRPFTIKFEENMIDDLKQRLRNRRPFTQPLEGIQSQYGINTIYFEENMKYWLDKYDFKKREQLLNKLPHFKTRIQGLDLHFIRVKPDVENKKVLPIMLLHGWPSSSKEFDKVIPLLTTPRDGYDFVFEVISPDLPGFGFSEGTNKPGLNSAQMAIVMRNLMKRLGFNQFYLQGGDWGSQVGTHMSVLFPNEILGFHTNMPLSSMAISSFKLILGSLFPSLIEKSERIYPLSNYLSYIIRESGYFHLQATKPDTIGLALTDSPVSLAGYLMEKIGVVSNRDQLDTPHGGLANLDIDDVLDTVTIMWANRCQVTATRIYAESTSPQWPEVNILHAIPSRVPTAGINFRYEVLYQPTWVLKDKFRNLVRNTIIDFGGHFAALQTPDNLTDDIFDSVVAFRTFHDKNRTSGVL